VEPTTLGYALLGLLACRPRTGYELTQALRAPVGYFWNASHSQVYPELARLEAAQLVRHRIIDGPGPRDTKQYSVTASGRRTLAEWAVTPADPQPQRDEFLLKVYSIWTADPQRALPMIETQRSEHIARLAEYESIEAHMISGNEDEIHNPRRPAFAAYATLRRGLSFERHAIAWCDWMIDSLAGAQPSHTKPKRQSPGTR
jgi:DNA-binding PadR family transcriptional regulator